MERAAIAQKTNGTSPARPRARAADGRRVGMGAVIGAPPGYGETRAVRRAGKPGMVGAEPTAGTATMDIALDVIVVLLLIVLNGVLSLSELALISANRVRLAVLERKGVPG